jgi:hypothetical protein
LRDKVFLAFPVLSPEKFLAVSGELAIICILSFEKSLRKIA